MRIFFLLSALSMLAGCQYYDKKSAPQSVAVESISGLRAFRGSVFPFVRANCVGCHGGTQSPLFAQAAAASAYRFALPFANFEAPAQSVFVVRSQNGHCGAACRTDGSEMRRLIETWWAEGQQGESPKEPNAPLLKTASLPLSDVVQGKFKRLSWSLAAFGSDYGDAEFSLEVKREGPSLRFRAPRLSSGRSAIRVRGTRVVVDGIFDVAADVFRRVDVVVNSGRSAVLATQTGLFTLRGPDSKEIAVEFSELVPAAPNHCWDLTLFRDTVAPILEKKCARCHGVSSRLLLSGTSAELCAEARQRASLTDAEAAPLVLYPYLQRNDHPIKAIGELEARTILTWLRRERDAESEP